jgi:branched-chain amino acid transport system substrate-binding protein
MTERFVCLPLLLIGMLAAQSAFAQNTPGQAIGIGVIAPISGPAATYGKDLLNGVNLAVDEINAAGGAGGHPLAVVVGDDRASPKDAANVAQSFVSNPKVLAMVGGITSTATFGAVPVAQKGKLPFVITLASHPDLTREGDYIFRDSITQDQEAPAIGRMVATCLAPKTVAIMYLNNDWGLAMTEGLKKSLAASGIRIVAEESYDPGETVDYSAKLAKIRSANPDVIWFGSQYNDLAMILKQAQRANLGSKPMVASTAAYSAGLTDVAGAAANNLYLHAPFSSVSTDAGAKAFSERFERKYKAIPGATSAQAYESVYIVAREAERGGFTRDGLQKALATMPPFPGLGGMISFDPQTREATGKTFTPMMIKDKSFVLWADCQDKLK